MKRALFAVAAAAAALVAGLTVDMQAPNAAAAAGQASSRVAVIPGLHAPVYPGTNGLPMFPVSLLGSYSFTEVAPNAVTTAALQSYDTVILYGQRWNDLPSSAHDAINAFAHTGKVLIWDADSTGAQTYGSFVHPFSTLSSGESGAKAGSVVAFPSGPNPFASSNVSDATYLDPEALTSDGHLVAHMNVMRAGAPEWSPALLAANKEIPSGGWVLAWGYGVTTDHTGMVVYSGLDADAFHDPQPNYAIKELSLQLAAPFNRSAETTCAPTCKPPTATGSIGQGGSGGRGTFAQCSFPRKTTKWVHGSVPVVLKTSVADGVKARPETVARKALGALVVPVSGRATLKVNTKLLPSNRATSFLGVVYVRGTRACSAKTSLRVDNIAPRVLGLGIRHTSTHVVLRLRMSEAVRLTGLGRPIRVAGRKTIDIVLRTTHGKATLVLADRASNSIRRTITWG